MARSFLFRSARKGLGDGELAFSLPSGMLPAGVASRSVSCLTRRVCDRDFEWSELRKHSDVGLVPIGNGAAEAATPGQCGLKIVSFLKPRP